MGTRSRTKSIESVKNRNLGYKYLFYTNNDNNNVSFRFRPSFFHIVRSFLISIVVFGLGFVFLGARGLRSKVFLHARVDHAVPPADSRRPLHPLSRRVFLGDYVCHSLLSTRLSLFIQTEILK